MADESNNNHDLIGEEAFKGEDRTVQSKKRMLEALKVSLGVVTPALQTAQVGRNTYYQWIREDSPVFDAYFKRQVKELNNVAHDFAEHSLHKQILAGNTSATIFYLKTQVRHRGYIERPTEVDINDTPRTYLIVPAKQIE